MSGVSTCLDLGARGSRPWLTCEATSWLSDWERQATAPKFRDVLQRPRRRPPRIPRRIFQTSPNASVTLAKHGESIGSWQRLNPEYRAYLFDEADCSAFMHRFGTPLEVRAYESCLVGSQRSDLFRVIFLRILGGVYADTDMELRKPLRQFVPWNASVVASERWEIEFMAYEPNHPVLEQVASKLVENVNRQVDLWRARSPERCTGPHSCIIHVTGPPPHRGVVIDTVRTMGCHVNRWVPAMAQVVRVPGSHGTQCANGTDDAIRHIHVCRDSKEKTSNYLSMNYCGAMRHWDCRNSLGPGRDRCNGFHYSKHSVERGFFRDPSTGETLRDSPELLRKEKRRTKAQIWAASKGAGPVAVRGTGG